MPRHYTFHDGELRLYDNRSPTPYCYQVKFVQTDPQLPADRPRPLQRLVLDRGRASSAMRYTRGPDNPLFDPIQINFTAQLDERLNRNGLWQALVCGTVGVHNWTSTKGTSQLGGVTLPAFDKDTAMQCVNVEILYTGNTTNWGRRLKEVFFPPEQIRLGAATSEGIPISIVGMVYGPIISISAFTTPRVMSTGGASNK